MKVSEWSLMTALWLVAPNGAHAQRLRPFLDAASTHAIDVREAEALADQARGSVDESRARLLPSFTASGAYQRNEYEVVVSIPTGTGTTNDATFTPYDQLSATFTLNVPIVDLSAWVSFSASERSADAADARVESASFDAFISTATAYYQLVAAHAVLASSARALGAAEENLRYVQARVGPGLASELDEARATADVARAAQTVAEAELQVTLGTRNLFVLTGIEAEASDATLERGGPLDGEGEVSAWVAHLDRTPAVHAARLDREAAERLRDAAWFALAPTLSGAASERLTNASGFSPQAQWALSITLSFTLDFSAPAVIATRDGAVATATVREERAAMLAETQVREAFFRVRSLLARVEAARAGTSASERGVQVAHARFDAGTGTALDISNAERDLFAAEVAEIQAEADLLLQRDLLRLRTGVELGARP